jgi:Tfp pilus assembly protein PilP
MKLTTGIVALAITAGSAWAQNPAIIQNTKAALQGVQQQKTADSNAALHGSSPAKPSGAVPAKPGTAGAQTTAAKPAPVAAPKPTVETSKTNSGAKLVPAKAVQPAAKAQPASTAPATAKAPTTAKAVTTAKAPATVPAHAQTPFAPKPAAAPKTAAAPAPAAAPKVAVKASPATPKSAQPAGSEKETAKADKPEDKKYSMTGKRDPFLSPVVNRQTGSGCSTGKKCLDIEQIALHGVVKSDNGMIAVVTNGLNKAYFLRENDPVFNGYVVRITVDSIVFKQNVQDRLGKPFTKDVVKRILTPAV